MFEYICNYCKNTFVRTRPLNKKFKIHFCSKKCQNKGQIKPNKFKNCPSCGALFGEVDYIDSYGCKRKRLNKFCPKCKDEHGWTNGGVEKVLIKCKTCGKEFKSTKNRRDKHHRKYCSSRCYGKYINFNTKENYVLIKKETARLCALFGSVNVDDKTKKIIALIRATYPRNKNKLTERLINKINKGETYAAYT